MTASRLGQLTVMLIILAASIYGLYCLVCAIRANRKLTQILKAGEEWARNRDHGRALEEDWNWDRDRRIERQRVLLRMADAMVEQDSEWQQRARRAEGLGFMDDVA